MVTCAAPSCTTCATCPARRPASRKSCPPARRLPRPPRKAPRADRFRPCLAAGHLFHEGWPHLRQHRLMFPFRLSICRQPPCWLLPADPPNNRCPISACRATGSGSGFCIRPPTGGSRPRAMPRRHRGRPRVCRPFLSAHRPPPHRLLFGHPRSPQGGALHTLTPLRDAR